MTPMRAWQLLNINADVDLLGDIKPKSLNLLANNGFQKAKNGPIKSPYLGAPVFSFDPTAAAEAKVAAPTS